MDGARAEAIVRATSWAGHLEPPRPIQGPHMEVSTSLDAGAGGCPISEKADPSSEESAREGCREEHEFREPSPAGPIWSH